MKAFFIWLFWYNRKKLAFFLIMLGKIQMVITKNTGTEMQSVHSDVLTI